MNIKKKIKSWDGIKDCFGYKIPNNIDHIYPIALGGTDVNENKQKISQFANEKKADKTKGNINGEWRFSIVKKTLKNQNTHGVMYIRNKSWEKDNWYEVIPVL